MPKRMSLPDLYSRSEALQRLKISAELFQTYVRNGAVEAKVPEGRKQTFYTKVSVNKLAKSLSANREAVTFAKIRVKDMDSIADIVEELFDHRPNVERWKEYILRNPDIGYLVRTPDKIVGCGFVFPLSQESIQAHIDGPAIPPPISPDEILAYDPAIPVHLYVRSVGITKQATKTEKRFWGKRLLSGLISGFVELGQHGIEVKTIQSRSNTRDGIRILRHAGFTEVASVTSDHKFIIDVETSGLPVIQAYKRAFAFWKETHV